MWIVQIVVASFWWYLAMHLLYREATVWRTVERFGWFRERFYSNASGRWERFCRDAGIVCAVVAGLLFLTLPYGMGAFGLLVALPPMLFLL